MITNLLKYCCVIGCVMCCDGIIGCDGIHFNMYTLFYYETFCNDDFYAMFHQVKLLTLWNMTSFNLHWTRVNEITWWLCKTCILLMTEGGIMKWYTEIVIATVQFSRLNYSRHRAFEKIFSCVFCIICNGSMFSLNLCSESSSHQIFRTSIFVVYWNVTTDKSMQVHIQMVFR